MILMMPNVGHRKMMKFYRYVVREDVNEFLITIYHLYISYLICKLANVART